MSKIALEGNASGTGTLTIASQNTNSNYTLTLPNATGTIITTAGGLAVAGTTADFSSTIKGGATVSVGGATPSASGAGITFPATESASSDANTLDDYEEGTFTPTFTGSTGNPTVSYSQQTATYTKIGNRVFFEILIVISSVSAQGTGTIRVSGLPFSEGGASYEFVCPIGYNDVFDTAFPSGYINGTNITIIPAGVTQANASYGTPASSTQSNLSSGYFSISGCYIV